MRVLLDRKRVSGLHKNKSGPPRKTAKNQLAGLPPSLPRAVRAPTPWRRTLGAQPLYLNHVTLPKGEYGAIGAVLRGRGRVQPPDCMNASTTSLASFKVIPVSSRSRLIAMIFWPGVRARRFT